MVAKANASRIERYMQNADRLAVARKKAILAIAACIVLVLADWVICMVIFYHDKRIGLEPIFWVILIGIMLVGFLGEFIAFKRFTRINSRYHEAVERFEKLASK